MDADAPILEFDPAPTAVIEPNEVVDQIDIPPHVVLCFFQDVIQDVVERHGARQIDVLISEIGHNPVYELELGGSRLALVHPGVGAPLAAAFLEELIARRMPRVRRRADGAGILVPDVALGHVIVPTSAVRDEGTSYHYLAARAGPSRRRPRRSTRSASRCDAHDVPFVEGATWTTDALYRETRGKVERRVAEGCLTVEMEAAAFFAVAAFRDVTIGQLLYAGDDLSGDGWDGRGWDEHLERTRAAVPAGGRGGARPLVP